MLHKATPAADKLDGYRISATSPAASSALLLCVTASARCGGASCGKRFAGSVEGKTHSTNVLQLQEVGDFHHKCSYEERMFD